MTKKEYGKYNLVLALISFIIALIFLVMGYLKGITLFILAVLFLFRGVKFLNEADSEEQADESVMYYSQTEQTETAQETEAAEDEDKYKAPDFVNTSNFVFDEHKEKLESLSNASEVVEYLEKLGMQDDYFKNVVMPKMLEIKEIERMYGNRKESILNTLKELTDKK